MVYRDIINKDKKFKFDTSRPVKSDTSRPVKSDTARPVNSDTSNSSNTVLLFLNFTSDSCQLLTFPHLKVNLTHAFTTNIRLFFPYPQFSFVNGDVPLAQSYGVYIVLLVRFGRICINVSDIS